MGNRVGIAQCIEAIARCAEMRGSMASAIRLLGSSAALFDAVGVTPPSDRNPAVDAASLRTQVSTVEFDRAWEAGQTLSPDDAAAEALAVAEDLVTEVHTEVPAVESPSPAVTLGLTPREVAVLRLLAEGMSDREIAVSLSISERTAGNHVQHAMRKIGVDSRTAAAVFAIRNDVV
jgi:DNA-binding CsgD family transcriptional regulator